MAPAVDVEAYTHHSRRNIRTANGSTRLATRTRLAAFLCIFCYCQWVVARAVAPFFTTGGRDDADFSPAKSSGGLGIRPGAGITSEGGGNGSSAESVVGGGRGASGVVDVRHASHRPPRILTVLTTYGKRSSFVKPYKEAVSDRDDGYRPTVSAVR